MKSYLKRFLYVIAFIVILAVFAGPLATIRIFQVRAMMDQKPMMPPTTVTASPAATQTWEDQIRATGTLTAVQGVTVSAEMAGKVAKIAFEPGTEVKAGDLLVQIDISTEQAQLESARASAALAKANLERAQELRKEGTNSAAELDTAEAQAQQADAQVRNIQTMISKKTVRAPFSGRLGLRMVNLGQILKEGDPITTLQTLDPIYVDFSLPQQRIDQLATGDTVRVSVDAAPGKAFEGKINAISPQVDPLTRNVRVEATIDNKASKLRAGMFANVQVVLPTKRNVLAVPATAVLYAPYGDSVFVIDEKKNEQTGQMEKVLRQQLIRLGDARGDFVAVVEGLKTDEMVVTSGAFKLHAGMPVIIDNTLAPHPELNPKPKNA